MCTPCYEDILRDVKLTGRQRLCRSQIIVFLCRLVQTVNLCDSSSCVTLSVTLTIGCHSLTLPPTINQIRPTSMRACVRAPYDCQLVSLNSSRHFSVIVRPLRETYISDIVHFLKHFLNVYRKYSSRVSELHFKSSVCVCADILSLSLLQC